MYDIPIVNLEKTGQNIERLRLREGLTVRKLQEIFGFGTPQAIYKWQRGDALPTVDNLVVLSTVFGVTINEILVIEDAGQKRLSA